MYMDDNEYIWRSGKTYSSLLKLVTKPPKALGLTAESPVKIKAEIQKGMDPKVLNFDDRLRLRVRRKCDKDTYNGIEFYFDITDKEVNPYEISYGNLCKAVLALQEQVNPRRKVVFFFPAFGEKRGAQPAMLTSISDESGVLTLGFDLYYEY